MKEIPDQILPVEDTPNFHEISESRKELRKAIAELGIDPNSKNNRNIPKGLPREKKLVARASIEELGLLDKKADKFKIVDYGGFDGAREKLESIITAGEKDLTPIDLESIFKQFPDIERVIENKEYLQYLINQKFNLRLRLNRVEKVGEEDNINLGIDSKDLMIDDLESELSKIEFTDLRASELAIYKQNLSESGHICITESTKFYLNEIGNKMLSGKPIFLHGPTGTGKTTLAEYAAKHFTGKDAEMVYCSPQTKESNTWGHTGIKSESGVPVTVFIDGPLAKAIKEGRVIIFDEFTD